MQISVSIYYGFKWTADLITDAGGDFTEEFRSWVAENYSGADPTDLIILMDEEGTVDNFVPLRDGTRIFGFYAGCVAGQRTDNGKFTSQRQLDEWRAEMVEVLTAWGVPAHRFPDIGVFADFNW